VRGPQRPLGLVDRGHHVLVGRVRQWRRQPRDTLAVAVDVLRGDRQFGEDVGAHASSLPDDGARVALRRANGARGRALAAEPNGQRAATGGSVALARVTPVPVRDDLRALEGYHSPQVDVRVRLNTNESPTEPPAAWRDAFAAEMSRVEWHRYPDRAATALRDEIGAVHGVGGDQVFAANGSNEVLQTLLLTYAGPGRTVATFEPTYQLHGHIARLTGATVRETDRAADFSLDLPAALAAVAAHRPMVTFLCSPNNPTGLVEPAGNVRALLDAVPGLLVVDEAYGQFADWSAERLLAEDVPLAVTRTFSKTWSMAGSRLGYLVGPRWLVTELDKVVLPYHLDAGKQIAGRLALRFVDEMEARVHEIVSERERIATAFDGLPVDHFPSGANFILFRPRSETGLSGRQVWQGLLDRSVLIRDCSGWPRLTDCLRITIGTPAENDEFLDALAAVLSAGVTTSTAAEVAS
jgi:histidinol-phosphate aminotransferase